MTRTASAAAPVSIKTGSPCDSGLNGAATNEGRLSTLRSGRKGRPGLGGALCLWLAVCCERRAGFASARCPVAADAATAAGLSIAPVCALAVLRRLPVDRPMVDPTEDCELVVGAVVLLSDPAPVDEGAVVDPPVDRIDPLERTGSGDGDVVGGACGDGAEVPREEPVEPVRCGSGVGRTVAAAVMGRLRRATHARTIHGAPRRHPGSPTLRNATHFHTFGSP